MIEIGKAIGAAILAASFSTVPALPAAAQSRAYAAVDLSTPEAAVAAYAEAFADEDFLMIYLLLAPETHMLFRHAVTRFELGSLADVEMSEIDFHDTFGAIEHAMEPDNPALGPDFYQVFIYYMSAFSALDRHLIDFPQGGVTVAEAPMPSRIEGTWIATVDTDVKGEGDVRFFLRQSPGGLWRISHIVARPGAADEVTFLPPRE